VLDAVAAIDVDLAGIVGPCDAEADGAVGFDETFEEAFFEVLGVGGEEGPEGVDDLGDGLEEFRFAGVTGGDVAEEGSGIWGWHDAETLSGGYAVAWEAWEM
jgi:hypothetical protein